MGWTEWRAAEVSILVVIICKFVFNGSLNSNLNFDYQESFSHLSVHGPKPTTRQTSFAKRNKFVDKQQLRINCCDLWHIGIW
jgi:hypothetical protein